jgi:hypothetical protein
MQLRYLFTAYLKDGSFIDQNEEDVSSIDPSKSAFYDVLLREDDLATFILFDTLTGNNWQVDLESGTFTCNGIEFHAGDPRTEIPEDSPTEAFVPIFDSSEQPPPIR